MTAEWQKNARDAFLLYRLGQTKAALHQISELIETNPNEAVLHYFLGVFYVEIKQFEEASRHLYKAVQLSPSKAEYHQALGVVYAEMGNEEESAKSYEAALKYNPNSPDTLNSLGVLLSEKGEPQKAIQFFKRVIALDPDRVDAYNNVGNVYTTLRLFGKAKKCFLKAIELDKYCSAAYCGLGCMYYKMGEFQKSVNILENARLLGLETPGIYHNLAGSLRSCRRYEDAKLAYEKESELSQSEACKLRGYADIALYQNDYEKAEIYSKALIELNPHKSEGYEFYGYSLYFSNQFDLAISQFRKAIELDPNNSKAASALGLTLLKKGQFEEGWLNLKNVRRKAETSRCYIKPSWNREDISDKILLVYTGAGFGDTIQFLRFLPELKAKAGKLIIECELPLLNLVKRLEVVDEVVSKADPNLPNYDYRFSFLALGEYLHLTNDNITRPTPYLKVDPEKKDRWQNFFSKKTDKKQIGVVWTGNPQFANNHHRSMPFHYLKPLLQSPEFCFYSLLKLMVFQPEYVIPGDSNLVDLNPFIFDLSDTAAIISSLDLVITVDTSTAHLAGALGKPVWILLHYSCDWRWGIEGENTPWYPTARLFRQKKAGDWATVIDDVKKALLSEFS